MFKKKITIKFLIKIASLFMLLFNAYVCDAAEQKQIIVVFRYDDYSNSSPTNIEHKVIDDLQMRNFACTFGVIPFANMGDLYDANPGPIEPLNEAKIKILKDAARTGFLEVALHGYTHQKSRNKSSEFYGVDYESQSVSISKGKEYLEETLNVKITTFVPPWNSYDMNTIRALEHLEFGTISADRYGIADKKSSLNFLPETCDLSRLQEAVELARLVPDKQPVIVALFHHYSFLEVGKSKSEISYQDFVKLLDWIKSQKDVCVLSIDQTTKAIKDLNSSRYITWSKSLFFRWRKILPPPLQRFFPTSIYLSQDATRRMGFLFCILALIFYLAGMILSMGISFGVGLLIFPKSKFFTLIAKYCLPITLVCIAFFTFYDLKFNYRGAIITTMVFGACMGMWGSLLRLRLTSSPKTVPLAG